MQDYDLKSPGDNQQAQTLRLNTARAISVAKNEVNPKPDLANFLLDAATKAPGYVAPGLGAGKAIVSNAQAVNVQNTSGTTLNANATCVVTGTALTDIKLPATIAALKNGNSRVFDGKKYTFTVSGGAITNIVVEDAAGQADSV